MGVYNETIVPTQLAAQDYVEVVSLALLYYDYLLTFELELERFWQRPKLSLVSVLFYLNRYGVLLSYIPTLVFFIRPDLLLHGNTCYIFQRVYVDYRLAFTHSVIAVILVVRTSALYAHDRRVLIFLVVIVAVMDVNGVTLWCLMDKSNIKTGSGGGFGMTCINLFTDLQGAYLAGTWGGLFILDFAVFVLTLRKTFSLLRDCPDSITLWSGMMRDGAVYFGVLSITNLSNILMLLFAPTASKTLLTDLINILATTMVSRLTLNLRDKSLSRLQGDTLTTRATEVPLHFATIKTMDTCEGLNSEPSHAFHPTGSQAGSVSLQLV